MYGMKAIISKELTRVFKDKKLIMSLFVMPVALVIAIFALMSVLITNQVEDVESHRSVVYMQNAPETFKYFLEVSGCESDITYIEAGESVDEIKDGILNASVDLLIVFPEGFEILVLADAGYENLVAPDIRTYYNPSEDYSAEARSVFVSQWLEAYRQSLLVTRFGSIDAVNVFTIDYTNTESVIQDDNKAMGKMLGMMLPYFITMLIFATAMSMGVDMIAGEKERGTLASMLLSPINRTQIVLGKVVSLGIISIMSAAMYVITMLVAMPIMFKSMGVEAIGGMSISFSAAQIIQFVVLLIGVVLLYVSIICLVAVFAKNTKEASSFISPVYILVIFVGFMTMYSTGTPSTAKYAIPLYGSSMAFSGILAQEITSLNYLVAVVSTYAVSLVFAFVMTKAFNSEKVMFNA